MVPTHTQSAKCHIFIGHSGAKKTNICERMHASLRSSARLDTKAGAEGRRGISNPFSREKPQKEVSNFVGPILYLFMPLLRNLELCLKQNTNAQLCAVQEEARKALEGLFQGKKDTLAVYDVDSGSGGGSRGGKNKFTGGGGDGGRGGQFPDWREWSSTQWKKLGRSLRAVTAVVGFVGTSRNLLYCLALNVRYRHSFSPVILLSCK